MSKPLIIGLTGGIASGKTTVANYLATLGAHLIDTDVIARDVVLPNAPTTLAIRDLLGESFLLADGNLNRAKIKSYIFNHAAIKTQYESIIMPAIRQATLQALDNRPTNGCYTVLIVPLLFEKGLDEYCDYTISVDIPVTEQISRGIARKPSDEKVIRHIIKAQLPRETRNARADFVINNHVPIEQLHAQLNQLHQHLCQLPCDAQ